MFGIDIFDGSLSLSLVITLLAGLLSFLSPCVLPIVPPYLAYMTGSNSGGGRRAAMWIATCFVLGLSTVFLILGAAASFVGQALLAYQQWFGPIAGAVVFIFGLHFVGLIRLPFLFREARLDAGDRGGTPMGAYILGLAFAFGWTPCIGPILSGILAMVAQEASLGRGMVLMGAYAAGLGIPFLIAAYFLDAFAGATAGFRRHMNLIEKIMGVVLMLVGVLLAFGGMTWITFWLLETFPVLSTFG